MAKFKYFEPADLAETLSLLQKYGDESGYGNVFYSTGVRIKDLPLLPHNGLTHLAGRGLL